MDEIIGTRAKVALGNNQHHTTETGVITDWFIDDNLTDWYRVKLDGTSFTVTVPFGQVEFLEPDSCAP